MNKSSPHKRRAVFLAALMICSVFAGTVAFAGTTSAAATSLDLGSGDGNDHTVDQGTQLNNVQVDDDDPDNATLFVFIDENGNGAYDDGEEFAANVSAYNGTGADANIDISPLATDGLASGVYTVYAYENESLNDGDSTFDTSVNLTLDPVSGATNLDLGAGDNTDHTVDQGTPLETVQVDDNNPGSSTLFVFIDENGNGVYDDGEEFAVNESAYSGTEANVNIGTLETSGLSVKVYDVYAYENESLNDGDSGSTSVRLKLEDTPGATNLDLGSGDGNEHTIDRGTVLENVQVDDDNPRNTTLFVFVDENDNGVYDSGEPVATNESAYLPNEDNVDIGTLATDNLAAGTYDIHAVEAETLNDGDSDFDTSVSLTVRSLADASDYDTEIASGATFWAGQELLITGGGELDPNTELQLRSWDSSDDQIGGLEEEFSLDGSGTAIFETEGLDGYYVIVLASNNNVIVQFDGRNGQATGTTTDVDNDGDSASFEIVTQDFDVSFDDDEVTEQGSTTVTFDSNRGTYAVNVSADRLSAEELATIFGDGSDQNGELEIETVDSDEDRITLAALTDGEYDIGFTGIDTGEYDFEFEVTDTSASDSATIEVTERDVDAEFEDSSYIQTAGDVVTFTIELEDTDDAFVQFGDEEAGFIDVLYIEDEDDDDEVTFQVNTRALGTNARYDEVYHSEDDIVESELHGGISSAARDPVFVDEDGDDLTASGASDGSFAAYLDELGLIDADDETPTNQLVRPLQPTDYDIAVGGDNTFIVNDDEESVLNDELDLTVLDLTRPNLGEIETFVAPADTADENDEIGELREALTAREEVAFDDRLIIRAEASGIYGHMVAIEETSGEDGFSALEEGFSAKTLHTLVDERDGEGVNLEVQADDAIGNQEPTSLNLGSDTVNEQDIFVLADNTEGVLYIVVDTSSSDAFNNDIDSETDFTVEFEYETDEDDSYEFESAKGPLGGAGGDPDSPAFPYFQPGENQSKSAAFTIAEREVLFANPNDEGIIEVAVGGITDTREGTIFGSTNVAPGSDASVRIRSDRGVSPSFAGTNDVMIDEEGEFEATFEFTDANLNNTAEVTFRVGGSTVGSNKMVIVEQLEPTPAETTTVETTTETTTRIPTVTRGTAETSPPTTTIGTPIPTPTTTPGFGVGTALVALVAAALLVVRREI
ncbi:BGTF surface domain-containing protein [Halobellus inordinatus]|uniref:BGTF surface domain-containing protein n=1 Tax=Halobellus inordinatus TaxID=1126236 RepID=UPI002114081F|nr:BGTF surface domain-containing protein [Halobellus ramosii]